VTVSRTPDRLFTDTLGIPDSLPAIVHIGMLPRAAQYVDSDSGVQRLAIPPTMTRTASRPALPTKEKTWLRIDSPNPGDSNSPPTKQ